MNKDQVAGRVEEAKGKIKEVAGKVTGSDKLQTEGVVDQAAGKVLKTYGDRIKFVYRHFPLPNHPAARPAAEAAACAQAQGKFWEYHDRLFEAQPSRKSGSFATDQLKLYGAQVGLDAPAFDACIDAGRHLERVKAETERGRAKGVTSTPTLFVNGRKIEGVPPPAVLDAAIATALRVGRLPVPGA